jgi:aldehyde:ferredoxin oxidoreductase
MKKILKIDLSTRNFEEIQVSRLNEELFLGGASLAARLLYDELSKELDPFDPAAPLLFITGPLTGTSGPAVGRFVVCGRSPATKLWAESNCGGFWGPELRRAGFDGLWITGRSDSPVYISIQNHLVSFRSAEHLWGLDTYSTQFAIESELNIGKISVAVIGPAGESLIPFALVMTDHGRMAGRTGMGAVMGSKNLKAIAVQGGGKVPVVDLNSYVPLRSAANKELKADAFTSVLHELGSAAASDYFDYLGEMPKRYFQNAEFLGAANVSGASVRETILTGISACHACVIACGRVVKLADGVKRKGPEYETLVGFGPNLLIDNPVFITRIGELCDRYGMDSISLSNTIGLAFHLFEKGVITEKDTGGLVLQWGDEQVVECLVHHTIRREGLGELVAKGSRAFAKHYGVEEEAVQVNGLEVAYHDPRGASGMAIVYATSPRGACHNQSDYFLVDIGQVETSLGMNNYSRLGGGEKSANVAAHQDWRTIFNSLVLCYFANLSPETVVGLINAACGLDWTIDEMMRAGERGWNLKRAINNRLGLTAKNDRLPEAFLKSYIDVPVESGFVPDFDAMVQSYYTARGWDPIKGYPTRAKLSELELDWVIPDLWHDD